MLNVNVPDLPDGRTARRQGHAARQPASQRTDRARQGSARPRCVLGGIRGRRSGRGPGHRFSRRCRGLRVHHAVADRFDAPRGSARTRALAASLSSFIEGPRLSGIGMTSARTRERLVQRLREQGIVDQRVLDRIRNVPRHLFVDEALATRAYEDTALADRLRPDDLAALRGGAHDRGAARGGTGAQGARDRHRVRLSDGRAVAVGDRDLHHRAHREPGGAGAALAARAQDPQRAFSSRRRQRRLVGARTLRRDSADRRAARGAAGAVRATATSAAG